MGNDNGTAACPALRAPVGAGAPTWADAPRKWAEPVVGEGADLVVSRVLAADGGRTWLS